MTSTIVVPSPRWPLLFLGRNRQSRNVCLRRGPCSLLYYFRIRCQTFNVLVASEYHSVQLGKITAKNVIDQILVQSLTLFLISTALLQCLAGVVPESECKITTTFPILQIFRRKSVFYSIYLTFIHSWSPKTAQFSSCFEVLRVMSIKHHTRHNCLQNCYAKIFAGEMVFYYFCDVKDYHHSPHIYYI